MWQAIKDIGKYIRYLPALLEAIRTLQTHGHDIWKEIQDLRRELKEARRQLQKLRDGFDLPPPPEDAGNSSS